MAETSDRVSSVAARYVSITEDQIRAAVENPRSLRRLRDDVRAIAGSAWRQDTTKGLRGFVRKVTGL